jgi:alpha-beta hydrolase superfamily lysophospholipase
MLATGASLSLARTWLKRLGLAAALVLVTVLAVRAVDAWRSPPLKLWHTEVPRELEADDIDAADWAAWLKAEDAAFEAVRTRVTDKLPIEDRVAANRFFAGSPMNAANLATDWNRSQTLMPEGKPRGAVVLLHGLTDSPYSPRHIAARYRERGFVAVSIRMPGHGTVPGGLTRVEWQDWLAATRLAVRHARGLAKEGPLHLVGYSNGGALALKYTLDALEDPTLARPDQVVLISPMIGITSFARFAGVLGWPAVFPPFAKAAWLDVTPEYNPIKYNSFPVNAARQSSLLSRELQAQLIRLGKHGGLEKIAPVLTFQSTLDYTVDTRALVDSLYARLPANGSELVLFDRNHQAAAAALMKPGASVPAESILPPPPRPYSVTVLANDASSATVQARSFAGDGTATPARSPGLAYPPDVYSLSHVALPFPLTDGLYGTQPDPAENFGVRLGTVAVRGERSALVVSPDALMRMTSNPFFPWLIERIDATLIASQP